MMMIDWDVNNLTAIRSSKSAPQSALSKIWERRGKIVQTLKKLQEKFFNENGQQN